MGVEIMADERTPTADVVKMLLTIISRGFPSHLILMTVFIIIR